MHKRLRQAGIRTDVDGDNLGTLAVDDFATLSRGIIESRSLELVAPKAER